MGPGSPAIARQWRRSASIRPRETRPRKGSRARLLVTRGGATLGSVRTASALGEKGRSDRRAAGFTDGAICVQRLDDSLNSAIHTRYRSSRRSSSMHEPRGPPLKVVSYPCVRHAPYVYPTDFPAAARDHVVPEGEGSGPNVQGKGRGKTDALRRHAPPKGARSGGRRIPTLMDSSRALAPRGTGGPSPTPSAHAECSTRATIHGRHAL